MRTWPNPHPIPGPLLRPSGTTVALAPTPAALATVATLATLATLAVAGCGEALPGDGSDLGALSVVEPELELRVGSPDDPELNLTFITALEVDPDGRIYTLHRSERLVRVFDPDGALIRTLGGQGDGPGELQSPAGMGWLADTLWVLDTNGYRFSLFGPDGRFARSFAVPFGDDEASGIPAPRAAGLLPDGTIWGRPPAFSHLVQAGVITHTEIMVLEADGSVRSRAARFPMGRNSWGISDPDQPMSGGMYRAQPFADGPLWSFDASGEAILLVDRTVPAGGARAGFELRRITLEGDTVFARQVSADPVPVTQAEVDSILEGAVEGLAESPFFGDLAPGTARRWAEHGFYRPPVRPAVTAMRAGRSGEIWFRETSPPGGPAVWLRLSPNGEPVQRVGFPHSFRMLQAGDAHVWGSETDALDVPYLVRYRVPRP